MIELGGVINPDSESKLAGNQQESQDNKLEEIVEKEAKTEESPNLSFEKETGETEHYISEELLKEAQEFISGEQKKIDEVKECLQELQELSGQEQQLEERKKRASEKLKLLLKREPSQG